MPARVTEIVNAQWLNLIIGAFVPLASFALFHMVTIFPLSYVGLARAAALAGDSARARRAYQDFLARWKDADPDLPILKEARQEYAALK